MQNNKPIYFLDVPNDVSMDQSQHAEEDECLSLGKSILDLEKNTAPPFIVVTFKRKQKKLKACCATINADDTLLAVGFEDATIRVWNRHNDAKTTGDVNSSYVNIYPASDIKCKIDDCIGSTKCILLRGHTDAVSDLKFCHQSNYLFSTSFDGSLRAWNLNEEGGCTAIYKGHSWPIQCLDVSPLDKYVATGSQDTSIKLWFTDRVTAPIRLFAGHTDAISCVKFHPACTYLLAGSFDRTIRMFNIENGGMVRAILCSNPVVSLEIHPSGFHLGAISDNHSVCIWDLHTAALLERLEIQDNVESNEKVRGSLKCLSWSESTLTCIGDDGQAYCWNEISVEKSERSSLNIIKRKPFHYRVGGKPLALKNCCSFNLCIVKK